MSFVEILKQVLSSWHVYLITVVLVLFFHIVFYAARGSYPRRTSRVKKKKVKVQAAPAEGPEEAGKGSDPNDELGLEEA